MRGTLKQRFDAKWQYTPGCWLWTASRDDWGYGTIKVETKRLKKAHRVSYELYIGPIPEGATLMHTCDRPDCVNPHHLRPGTHNDNMTDMVAKGRSLSRRGIDNPNAVLTMKDVAEIKQLATCGLFLQKEVAAFYGVSQVTVSHIKLGRTRAEI